MSLIVNYSGGVKFEIECRSHKIVTDQPISNKGTDQGMTPVELLVASFASCVAYFSVTFLRRRFQDLSDFQVQTNWHLSEDPHRVSEINLTINLPYNLTENERRGLLKTVEHCTVGNTLKHTIKTRIELRN